MGFIAQHAVRYIVQQRNSLVSNNEKKIIERVDQVHVVCLSKPPLSDIFIFLL